jgi:hypothetical protein
MAGRIGSEQLETAWRTYVAEIPESFCASFSERSTLTGVEMQWLLTSPYAAETAMRAEGPT